MRIYGMKLIGEYAIGAEVMQINILVGVQYNHSKSCMYKGLCSCHCISKFKLNVASDIFFTFMAR